MEHYVGTLRITNPKTLKKWIDLGLYSDKINKGYIFNLGCGRFKFEQCVCSKCRRRPLNKLKEILIDNKILNNN